ncbi:hypothetical protein AOLI_G00014600 [Acnodon oligacanthus]
MCGAMEKHHAAKDAQLEPPFVAAEPGTPSSPRHGCKVQLGVLQRFSKLSGSAKAAKRQTLGSIGCVRDESERCTGVRNGQGCRCWRKTSDVLQFASGVVSAKRAKKRIPPQISERTQTPIQKRNRTPSTKTTTNPKENKAAPPAASSPDVLRKDSFTPHVRLAAAQRAGPTAPSQNFLVWLVYQGMEEEP